MHYFVGQIKPNNFAEFSNCKYHNTDTYSLILLKFLVKKVIHLRDFNEALQLEAYKETFKEKSTPKKELNKQQKGFLLTKMTVLLRLAENYLCNEALKSDSAKRNALLLSQVLKKDQFNLFKRVENKEKKRLSEIRKKDIENYEDYYQIELKKLDYLHKTGLLIKKDNLELTNEFLDIFYILNKINIFNTSLSISSLSAKKTFCFDILNDLKILLENDKYLNIPIIKGYLISFQLIQKKDQLYYFQLIELLDQSSGKIPESDQRGFYTIANNFCTKKIKEGKEEYYVYVFNQYKIMDTNNLIVEGNFVQVGSLKNLVTIGCKVSKYSWASNMVEKYKNSILKEYRLSVYHFNIGTIAYYKKQYDKALNHFIKVDKVNLAYDIDCRIMILKCHYELDEEYDERAMRRFVLAERYIQGNKELVKDDKKAYKNFIRFLLNLYRIKHNATRMTLESLLNKIEKAEFISDKKWLLEKIEDLENLA